MSGASVTLLYYAAFCGFAIAANLGLQFISVRWLSLSYWPSLVVGTGGGLVLKYVLDRNYIFKARGAKLAKDARRFALYAGFGLFTTAIFWSAEWIGHHYLSGDFGRYVGGALGLCFGYALKYWMDSRWVFRPLSASTMGPCPLIQLVDIPQHGDARGQLAVAELGGALPFVVRRVYWIYVTQPGVSRGFHAHKKLHQLCVCVAGSVRLTLFDGHREESVVLDSSAKGLLIGPGLWREMHDFSPDCVLMVFADAEYDEADYIRDQGKFLNHVAP